MNIIHYPVSDEPSTLLSQEGQDVVVSVDSSLVSTHQITLPKMSSTKARKAIPFALEPHMLDDINALKFFPVQQAKSATWEVLVISKTVIEKIEQYLDGINGEAISVIPDFMLLPYVANKVTYHESDGVVIFRNNYLQGGSLPLDVFNTLHNDKSQLVSASLNYDPSNKFSLFKANNGHWKEYLDPWKIPAMLVTVLFLFSIVQTLINNNALETQLMQLSTSNEQAFKALFPDVKRIVDLRIQAEQKLTKAKALKANYNNDLLHKLSSQSNTTIQASKVTLKHGKLTIEAIK